VPDVLGRFETGKQLKISFQHCDGSRSTIPIPLAIFATAVREIK